MAIFHGRASAASNALSWLDMAAGKPDCAFLRQPVDDIARFVADAVFILTALHERFELNARLAGRDDPLVHRLARLLS